jgi:uncharacterized protein
MELQAWRDIDASPERVWAALNDAEVLKNCIEGCESLEWSDPQTLAATVTAKVGPVKARFGGVVTLSDIVPNESYKISGEGKGGVAGFAKGTADVRLETLPEGKTRLHYHVSATVGGKLAQLGARLIDSTARAYAESFFSKLGEQLEAAAQTKAEDIVSSEAPAPVEAAASGGLPQWLWASLLLLLGAAALWLLQS